MNQSPILFWSIPSEKLLEELQTTSKGLAGSEAGQRLISYGPNLLRPKQKTDNLTLFLAQFKGPIILILLFAAILSIFLLDPIDAAIILSIVFISASLGFWQERGAANALMKLLAMVQVQASVIRDGTPKDIPVEEVVPGDVVILKAGDIIPGDCLILESKDLFVNEATLTGETFPVEKTPGILPEKTELIHRTNTLSMGTNVVNGTSLALVVTTGKETEFGKVSERLKLRPPETEFQHGVKVFGYFLMEITLFMVIAILAINLALSRPVLDSFLFALALAVGLTPQLLPAIISVNLAHGARRMAQQKVIVKRMESIENFGSMNVLCSDKTGTLTEGSVQVKSGIDIEGNEIEKVMLYACLNASFQAGFSNPIDEAIRKNNRFDISSYKKLDEVPYDFIRKRLSILVSQDGHRLMVTKGALPNVLSVCSSVETPGGTVVDIATEREKVEKTFEKLGAEGLRTLGVAYRAIEGETPITRDSEKDMVFLGLVVFFDPTKAGIVETISQLKKLGITLKIITGDSRLVALNVAKQVGIKDPQVITVADLRQMSDEALIERVNDVDLFAEVEPYHKERIIQALKKSGNVVGYMGDGINDASALHAADVGISVDSAVDVAKEAADIVLLEKDLGVLVNGVQEGRKTFANTLKYVFMATSANFGNMFSMAGASLFLSYLPLLPKQILLLNLLTDFPEMTIATDSVDKEMMDQPHRWNIKFIREFMLTFGILSSVFDYITFGVLLWLLHAGKNEFRSGWFLESVVSATLIVLVIRSQRPFFRSKPGKYLRLVTYFVIVLSLVIAFTPVGDAFGFKRLPASFVLYIAMIVLLYILTAEVAKRIFYKKVKL